MSSGTLRQYDHLRSRVPGVVLLATLVLAMPGVLPSQQSKATVDSQSRKTTTRSVLRPQATATPTVVQGRTTATGTAATSQDDVGAPQDSTPKPTTKPRQPRTATPRDSSFWQRFLTAVAEGLASRDTASQPPGRKVQQAQMPDLVGMDTMAALRRLGVPNRSRKPLVSYVIERPSPTLIPVDRIAAQLPAAGAAVTLPVSVRLTLAGVPRPVDSVIVPPLIGLLEDSAAAKLRAVGLVEDRLQKRVTAPDSVGRVAGQNPPAGRRIAAGGTVAIAIGQGARVIMPKVTGLTLVAARQRLGGAGIDVGRIRRDSARSTRPVGSVVRQLPESGTVVLPTTRIVLTQAVRAPAPPPRRPPSTPGTVARNVVMPNLVGLDSAAAVRTLRDSGLRIYRIVGPVNAVAVDTVRAQSPASGQRIPSTTAVELTLRAQDPVPAGDIWELIGVREPWLRRLTVAAFVVAVLGMSALTARRIWPPPQIVPRIRFQPMFTDIVGAHGSLVDVSVSLRSHVEHDRSVLDLTGSPLE